MLWIFFLLTCSYPQYTSRPYLNSSEAKGQSHDQIPGVYVPLLAHEKGACSITDKYCSYIGTTRNPEMAWERNVCCGMILALETRR